jgi:hypothetical protein
MRFVVGQRVSDLPEVAAPGSQIAVPERRKATRSQERTSKDRAPNRRSGPSFCWRELGKPKARWLRGKTDDASAL